MVQGLQVCADWGEGLLLKGLGFGFRVEGFRAWWVRV